MDGCSAPYSLKRSENFIGVVNSRRSDDIH